MSLTVLAKSTRSNHRIAPGSISDRITPGATSRSSTVLAADAVSLGDRLTMFLAVASGSTFGWRPRHSGFAFPSLPFPSFPSLPLVACPVAPCGARRHLTPGETGHDRAGFGMTFHAAGRRADIGSLRRLFERPIIETSADADAATFPLGILMRFSRAMPTRSQERGQGNHRPARQHHHRRGL